MTAPETLTSAPPERPRFRRPSLRAVALVAGGAVTGILIGLAGASGPGPSPAARPAATVTVTAQAQAAPAPTVTVTAPAPEPQAGALLGTFKGTGNQVTPAFTVPDSGNFIVTWSYSGNVDSSFGSSQPTNFAVSDNAGGFGDLPDDIAASGHGSTEVTGASGTDRLNVQAAGTWAVTVRAA